MKTILDNAKKYLGYQLSVIPTKELKNACCNKEPYNETRMDENEAEELFSQPDVSGIGIMCGKASHNLEVMELNCSRDRNGNLWAKFCTLVSQEMPELMRSMVIARTVNEGYQLYYRCEQSEGNKRLALNDSGQVLIEIKGEGGYVVAPPSPGYELVKGDLSAIQEISNAQREVLIHIARSLDERASAKNKRVESDKKSGKELPPFPIEGFPKELQEMIRTCSSTYRTPLDYWAGAVLIASALGIGSKMELVTNYRNVPVLWLVLVGDVSSGKSNPLEFCLNWFKRQDSASYKKYEEDLAAYTRLMRMAEKDRRLEGFGEVPAKPEFFQYILNDYTPEALASAHKTNNRGILIERDELKGWIDDFDRYTKSGEQSNLLSSWSRIGITYNRKSAGILNIERPTILVCGGMQPDLLPTLASDKRAENGFMSRLCAVYPDSTEKAKFNNATLPEEVRMNWENWLSKLTGMKTEYTLSLSEEAQKQYELWFNMNAERINREENGYLKGAFGKLDIISLRLAIIIHGMNMACEGIAPGEITGEEIESALAIAEYFKATAFKVYMRIFENAKPKEVNRRSVATYMLNDLKMTKIEIARELKTSRSQVDRLVA
jgi:hypothetical protein